MSSATTLSFMLQLFARVSPPFFQVVTDKVLLHRGFMLFHGVPFCFE